ncbi:hypothetical protein C1Y63_04435 [Corynebacterium sp. 13CS0277]|uniref:IS1096 element passenger TnpR family protein n=1 Tax=Corynebacterium sp. 13CS0277 TaxID=2071994 RepID=UPI000D02AB87|nr:hypothetical protein [Corynebacterium sp. 13CS0277]PRQ11664.1 hypothetical protein C1Y63_04435 [Corynebacterium sp. 13CS0277]
MTSKAQRLSCGDVFGPAASGRVIKTITLTNDKCDVTRTALVDISRPVCDIVDEFVVSLGQAPHPRTVLTLKGPRGGRNTYVGRAAYHYLHDNLIDGTQLQLAELLVPGRTLVLEASPMHGWRFELDITDPEPDDLEFVADQEGLIVVTEFAGTVVETIEPAVYNFVRAALRGEDIPPQIEWVVDNAQLVERIVDQLPDPLYDVLKFGAVRAAQLNLGAYPLLDVVLGEDARYTALVALVDYINRQDPVALDEEGRVAADVVTDIVEGESFLTYHLSKHQVRRAQYEPALNAAVRIGVDMGLVEETETALYLTAKAEALVELPTLQLVLRVAACTLKWLIDHDALDTIELEDGATPRYRPFVPPAVRTTFSAALGEVAAAAAAEERVLPTFVASAKEAGAHPLQSSQVFLPGEPLQLVPGALTQPHLVARVTLEGTNPAVTPAITRVIAVPWAETVEHAVAAMICLFGWDNIHPWYLQFPAPVSAQTLTKAPTGQAREELAQATVEEAAQQAKAHSEAARVAAAVRAAAAEDDDTAAAALAQVAGDDVPHAPAVDVDVEHPAWPVRIITSREQVYGPLCYRADGVQLSQVLTQQSPEATIVYDPGDDWRMSVRVLGVEQRPHGYYVDEAQRACPPEDCGGVAGFERAKLICDDAEGYILAHAQDDVAQIEKILAKFQDFDFATPQFPPGSYTVDDV